MPEKRAGAHLRSRYDGTDDQTHLPDELVKSDYFCVRDGKDRQPRRDPQPALALLTGAPVPVAYPYETKRTQARVGAGFEAGDLVLAGSHALGQLDLGEPLFTPEGGELAQQPAALEGGRHWGQAVPNPGAHRPPEVVAVELPSRAPSSTGSSGTGCYGASRESICSRRNYRSAHQATQTHTTQHGRNRAHNSKRVSMMDVSSKW